jgi:RNA-directed DNA polymerase
VVERVLVPLTEHLGTALAYALLAGPWTAKAMVERVDQALGSGNKIASKLALQVLKQFAEPPLGRERAFAYWIARRNVVRKNPNQHVYKWFQPPLTDQRPVPALEGLPIPSLLSVHDVSALTELEAEALDWFADLHRFNRRARSPRLRHYHYRWLKKRSGAYRLIEAPKPRLKHAQRRILDEILSKVPLHYACHGHRPGRSVTSFAAEHTGRAQLIKLDLAEFFNLITEARVRSIFASLGYNESIAALLAGLCCAPTPEDVLATRPRPTSPAAIDARYWQRAVLRNSHLPQGAPSSPALANLAAFRLDLRLSALAARFGARYGRYADDLAFSGDQRLLEITPHLFPWIDTIVREEGFAVRAEKTRVMPRSQRQALCGVVVNEQPALPRAKLQQLEAILFNCIRTGPAAQNREQHTDFRAHLAGRIAWAEHVNPRRAEPLRQLFERIDWSEG